MIKKDIAAIFSGLFFFMVSLFAFNKEAFKLYISQYKDHPVQVLAFMAFGAYVGCVMWFVQMLGKSKILGNLNLYLRSFIIAALLFLTIFTTISLFEIF